MRRQDTGVRPTGIARLAAAAALLAAVASCAAGATPTTPTSAARATQARSTSPGTPGASGKPAPKSAPTPASPRTTAPASPAPLPVAPPDAATLPQTTALPKTTDTAFANAVHDIWLAVTTGNPDYARPAFFPEKAYEQVKAIADPDSDWQGRLWYDFTLDLAAAHKLVKPGATLTKVTVPAQYAQWIPVGGCYNKAGYWHVPGARMVYREDGVTHSFGIASFISWRGDWYLVHFGAVVRSGADGIVDDPETGPGVPGPPGGC